MKMRHDGLARGLQPLLLEVAAAGEALPVHGAVVHEAELEHAVGEHPDEAGAVVALVPVPGSQGDAGSELSPGPDPVLVSGLTEVKVVHLVHHLPDPVEVLVAVDVEEELSGIFDLSHNGREVSSLLVITGQDLTLEHIVERCVERSFLIKEIRFEVHKICF